MKTPVFDQSRCVKYVQEEHELFAVSLSGKMKKKEDVLGQKIANKSGEWSLFQK